MARPFSSKDAKRIIEKHSLMISRLTNASSLDKKYKENIKNASDKLAVQEVLAVLRGIPVEELNREKKGIKTKTLRDHRYCNMADLHTASVYQIASIKGISEDSAYTIKRMVNDFVEQARREVKIKLSADNRNLATTELVKAIAVYRGSLKGVDACKELLFYYKERVEDTVETLKPATNDFKWFFTSKVVKNKAIEAYNTLVSMTEDVYFLRTNHELLELDKNEQMQGNVAWEDFQKNSVQFFTILEEINPGLLGTDDAIYGLPEDLAREIQDECLFPDGLLCSLRRYQEWGVKYILHQEKVLLGDEMGLGKTIQAIATMVSLKNTGATHFVVVCPASVVTNWCREIAKHSLLRVTKVHGTGRSMALKSWIKTGGVAVTTYETTSHFKVEDDFRFSLLVVDEAHYIKNPEARRTVNTVNLSQHAERLLFMTGTALENKVDEMIGLIQLLQPNIANQVKHIAFMSSAPQFREKIAPVYYRRKREDVLTELPELIESKEWCSLSGEEEELYERSVLEKRYADARRVSWNVDDLKNSSKAKRLLEIVEQAEAEDRKVIVFSFFLDTIRKINLFLGNRCMNPINGSVTPQRRQEIIDEFDKAPAGAVLTAQIQSGGTGLNIQSASVVVICEPQFKPSIENQAISRAYRMGQSRNVLVYRLLCEDTIDEKITAMLEDKQAIFDAFADKSVAARESLELDEKTFGNIINEEIERINAKYNKSGKKPEWQENQVGNTSDEYHAQMKLSYVELVEYLLKKYGAAKEDYFINDSFSTKNKRVSRTKEGLYCHHIDEDKAIMLSNDQYAKNNPFSYQKAERLVYCNVLEHLLLHIKIAEEPRNANANENELPGIGGAINLICREVNDFYDGKIPTQEWKGNIMRLIENNFEDYIMMLEYLWKVIQNDSRYSSTISKEALAQGWYGNIVSKVYERL